MDALKNSKEMWFSEVSEMWPGQALSFAVDETLLDIQSAFQHIQVFRTAAFGTVLVLDGCIQCTEKDEFAYHEMMVHTPMHAHPNPERVLVIGGGDGGCLRELSKHAIVKEITLCEIDGRVIEAAKEFLPVVACGFSDPRVTVKIGDGAEFLKTVSNHYDVVIVDASDPMGPGASLYSEAFYGSLKAALRAGGLICVQGESLWLHLSFIRQVVGTARRLFSEVHYANIAVPSYPSGNIGAILFANHDPRIPVRTVQLPGLQYYSAEQHAAAFVLPAFAKAVLPTS
eukprot:ANDGO_07545.mRNA.1 Spermidine synthase 1